MKQQFDFSEALAYLRQGKRVRRLGWSGASFWMAIHAGRFLVCVTGEIVDWKPYLADLDATDWVLVEEQMPSPSRYGKNPDKLIELIRRA